ncbi:alkaline phosphatase D family protein [Tenacibaculum sp. UWU-22]|uniref:alkaline phosphatase D family protein n=1 Tax=Tenacibaculum sp. UWU-22 TaxID=3234187 RepID=UPI0034DAC4A8
MNRRKYIKTVLMGAVLPGFCKSAFSFTTLQKWPFETGLQFKSDWQDWPDMKWVGPIYWGNRLQDWEIKDGKVYCNVVSINRNLSLLAIQKPNKNVAFSSTVDMTILPDSLQVENNLFGLRLGAKGPFDDYRSAAVFGKGLDIGLSTNGFLHIGKYKTPIEKQDFTNRELRLTVDGVPTGNDVELHVSLVDVSTGNIIAQAKKTVSNKDVVGNFALHADCKTKKSINSPSIAFSNWSITSQDLDFKDDQLYGPIYFAQYTLHKNKLKLTAQLAPIEKIEEHLVELQIKKNNQWVTISKGQVRPDGRAINFSLSNWAYREDVPYRVLLTLPLKGGKKQYEYLGTIAKEPVNKNEIKAAVFSCNFHYGFPDSDVVVNVSKLNPDIILFLGDQFYEGQGGYGVEAWGVLDKQCLDYLRKWAMFGWSYRDLFRHKPCSIMPDDHDVYHGNIWGEGGKHADTSHGFYAPAQDSGGYKMPAEWVNMVQFTQTSHLPDPFDPTPVKQGITVYYTNWNYAGISFAILEDRKFKSAPKNVLPEEAKVYNGFIGNPDFDIKKHSDIDAHLLGERQLNFLEQWSQDWSDDAQIKCVLSQTNFATVATLPKGSMSDGVVPGLPIPEKGEYVTGDAPTADMDSNGWPVKGRDKALREIRKSFAFHIAGDQHLASFIQYGIDEYRDSGFVFAGPALNNIWPRRFWPSDADVEKHTYTNPQYVGDHIDGFGNKMTVKAVANPFNTHLEPKVVHNRATGYGLVTFNKKERTIKTECWPRYADPLEAESQFPGWPVTVKQEDNYGRKAVAYLPTIIDTKKQQPLVKVFDDNDELVYAIRMKEDTFRPKVFAKGKYEIRVVSNEGETKFRSKAKRNNKKEVRV